MYFISCPLCCKPTQLPDKGATELTTAFLINNLLQIQDKLKKEPCELDTECDIHHDPLKVYCETCEELICRDCTVTKQHRNHDYNLISESYPKHHQQIEANLTTVKEKVADINTALTNLTTQEREVTKQGEDVKKEIHTQAQLIIDLVQQSERQLVHQVDTAVQQKIQLLTKQREVAETVLNKLKGCEEFVEQTLKVESQQQILMEKQRLIQVMTTVNQDVNPVVFQPIEETNIQFVRNQKLVGNFEGIGELKSKTFGKSVLVKNACYLGKKSTMTLNLQTQNGSPFSIPVSLISCQLSTADDSQVTACDINEIQSGKYNISFTPHTGGKTRLTVRLGGVNIPGSPFTNRIIPLPEMRGIPVNIISRLNRPRGVVVTKNEEIIVAERDSHCTAILNEERRKVRSLGTKEGEFTNPCGVAISHDGHILVTDNHRLQKLTIEGDCLKSVGSIGHGPLQFCHPKGITVHPTTGQIFIADTDNHRIQVLNNDLTYSHSFGKLGSARKQFKYPYDVAFDNEEYLYVVDHHNHCIKKFTPKGQYISQFGSFGSNPGQLIDPTSIIIDNNLVYVCEFGNNRVSISDIHGSFIHCFGKYGSGEGEFNGPFGITIDSLGNLYVSDTWNNRLVVL